MSIDRIPTPELFFGLVGPVGVDLDMITEVLTTALKLYNYNTEALKVTELMKIIPSKVVIDDNDYLTRITSRIAYADDACRRLRRPDALAAVIPNAVQAIREERFKKDASRNQAKIDPEEPLEKQAYVIRQFKRPDEIKLLRQIYGKLFFQISAYSSPEDREALIAKKIKDSRYGATRDEDARREAIKLMAIDYAEDADEFGQRIRETFPMADVFVDGINRTNCEAMIQRFVDVLFGDNSITPQHDEYGMYLAKSASLRSSDLSRQVGAAIFRCTGEVISLGCNEVPKFGGGTYWPDASEDARDMALGEDPNERIKREILYNILDVLRSAKKLSKDLSELGSTKEIMDKLIAEDAGIRGSKVMDLLEFGRIIHAEMSAITDAARLGLSTKDTILYSTTFPCHICAKHIVAAGIERVVFLEPYPKSYAKELHSDSIEVEGRKVTGKVRFEPFIGISPHRYRDLFEKGRRKDEKGQVKRWSGGSPLPIVEIHYPVYTKLETIASAAIKNQIGKLKEP